MGRTFGLFEGLGLTFGLLEGTLGLLPGKFGLLRGTFGLAPGIGLGATLGALGIHAFS